MEGRNICEEHDDELINLSLQDHDELFTFRNVEDYWIKMPPKSIVFPLTSRVGYCTSKSYVNGLLDL